MRSLRSPTGFCSSKGATNISQAAAEAGLGVRQFERQFADRSTFAPKLYARIVRFNAASEPRQVRRSAMDRHRPCLRIYDQMHMIRDFEDFRERAPDLHAAVECDARGMGHDVAFLLSRAAGTR